MHLVSLCLCSLLAQHSITKRLQWVSLQPPITQTHTHTRTHTHTHTHTHTDLSHPWSLCCWRPPLVLLSESWVRLMGVKTPIHTETRIDTHTHTRTCAQYCVTHSNMYRKMYTHTHTHTHQSLCPEAVHCQTPHPELQLCQLYTHTRAHFLRSSWVFVCISACTYWCLFISVCVCVYVCVRMWLYLCFASICM